MQIGSNFCALTCHPGTCNVDPAPERFLRSTVLTTKRIKVDKMFRPQTIAEVLDWKKSLTIRILREYLMPWEVGKLIVCHLFLSYKVFFRYNIILVVLTN